MSTTRITFSVNSEFAKYIKQIAKEYNKPVSKIIADIIHEWIITKNKKISNERLFNFIENNPLTEKDKKELYKELEKLRKDFR